MTVRDVIEYLIFGFSLFFGVGLWAWALLHALGTPRATWNQRLLWGIAMIVNPLTAIWYWYVWKRWAFWTLFTPILGLTFSLPLLVRSVVSRADATALTNALFALGSSRQVIVIAILLIFPMLLGLAALLHLGTNTELTAMDRNDWIVSLALPFFGFGAGIAYCARFRRAWAVLGLLWLVVIVCAFKSVSLNISHALIPAGEERREEFRLRAR